MLTEYRKPWALFKLLEYLFSLCFDLKILCIRMIKSKRIRCAGNVARKGEKRNAYGMLVGNSERKRPLGRP
jgi:hypothetical protein